MGWIVGLLVVIALLLMVLIAIGIYIDGRLHSMHTAMGGLISYLAELVEETRKRR